MSIFWGLVWAGHWAERLCMLSALQAFSRLILKQSCVCDIKSLPILQCRNQNQERCNNGLCKFIQLSEFKTENCSVRLNWR